MTKKAQRRNGIPEWADRIRMLRVQLKLSQSALGQQLQYSAMAISRWERGLQEPPADCYIKLGELAGNPDCWYFWERAGLKSSEVIRFLPKDKRLFPKSAFPDFDIVVAGSGLKSRSKKKSKLVAIPLLSVHAGAHGEIGDKTLDLDKAPAEDMIAAPAAWCPHPASTSCLRVKGMSMSPLIHDGDILAVDYSEASHADLDGKIVVAWHKDRGLCVSRFQRYRGVEVLEAENREYESVTLGSDRSWRIVGKILWWTRLAP
jgi:SOS-response transcriptional repressor LexA/DNA-binding XRE family transcriptional regulator